MDIDNMTLDDLAEHINNCYSDGWAFIAWWQNNWHTDPLISDWDESRGEFEDAYAGTWSSEADFAQDLATDIWDEGYGNRLRWPFTCIDWNDAWEELRIGGDYYSIRDERGDLYFYRNL